MIKGITLFLAGFIFLSGAFASFKSIYGRDTRKNVYELPKKLHPFVNASISIFHPFDLLLDPTSKSFYQVRSKVYGSKFGLCSDEKFYAEPSASQCSGVLISDNVLLTTGHCLQTESSCGFFKFVHGYENKFKNEDHSRIELDQVYDCKELIAYGRAPNADFALVLLDRAVKGAFVPSLEYSRALREGEPLITIGNPSGLPTKTDLESSLHGFSNEELFVKTDTFGGSSGSMVLSSNFGLLGHIIKGQEDFIDDQQAGCRRVKVISNLDCKADCHAETAVRIDAIKPQIERALLRAKMRVVERIGNESPHAILDGQRLRLEFDSALDDGVDLAQIKLQIVHDQVGELEINLFAPSGKRFSLLKMGEVRDFEWVKTIRLDIGSAKPKGRWILEIFDRKKENTGDLNSVSIEFLKFKGKAE